jgi:hypothetical protein
MTLNGIVCASPTSLLRIRPQEVPGRTTQFASRSLIGSSSKSCLRTAPLELHLGVAAPRTAASESPADQVSAPDTVERRSNGTGSTSVNRNLFSEKHAESDRGPEAFVDELPLQELDASLALTLRRSRTLEAEISLTA